jgi:citrate lyase beta subunit
LIIEMLHVLYGGAHLFRAETPAKMGAVAMRLLETHLADEEVFAQTFACDGHVRERVAQRLMNRPVDDFRIDFEDGFGRRNDDEEDFHTQLAAEALTRSRTLLSAGIRLRPWRGDTASRARRTLDLFLQHAGHQLPPRFVVTLPKVEDPKECEQLARRLKQWDPGVGIELMAETPQLFARSKTLLECVDACDGLCRSVHFGLHDFLSSMNVPSVEQHLLHPLANEARTRLQMVLAARRIPISDGATHMVPSGADSTRIRAVMTLHARNVLHAWRQGIRIGWDLHPGHIVARYAAIFGWYHEHLQSVRTREAAWRHSNEQNSLTGQQFDDAASASGLEEFLRQGVAIGAITREEASVDLRAR